MTLSTPCATPPKRDYFYWELHNKGFLQAIRFGDWKAICNNGGPIELYDLAKDESESNDLARQHPELVAKAEALMKEAHTDDPNWPVIFKSKKKTAKLI